MNQVPLDLQMGRVVAAVALVALACYMLEKAYLLGPYEQVCLVGMTAVEPGVLVEPGALVDPKAVLSCQSSDEFVSTDED